MACKRSGVRLPISPPKRSKCSPSSAAFFVSGPQTSTELGLAAVAGQHAGADPKMLWILPLPPSCIMHEGEQVKSPEAILECHLRGIRPAQPAGALRRPRTWGSTPHISTKTIKMQPIVGCIFRIRPLASCMRASR